MLPQRDTVLGVRIDMLRSGWPEQILTGRYSFATRRRDGLVQGLFEAVDLLTDGLIDKKRKRQLHLRVGGEPAMIVLKEAYPHLPPGIKLCDASPVAALLVLCERGAYRTSASVSLFEPSRYDVVDHRLGAAIGMLEATGGFVRPARTVIYGSSQQVLGQLTQPVMALVGQWLLFGRNRYDVTVNGVRVARIRQVRRLWVREYQVDVSAAAGLLDPRLILACALQKVRDLGDY
jgi:hypothetical protein